MGVTHKTLKAFELGLYILIAAQLFDVFNADVPLFFAPRPIIACPQNEEYRMCVSDCMDCYQRGICMKNCSVGGCDCLPHFYRLTPDGPCEPVNKCPIPECGENEVFRECGPLCERCNTRRCRILHCEHRCYCEEGYFRDYLGNCITEDECGEPFCFSMGEELLESGPVDEYCLHGLDSNNRTENKTKCYCKEGLQRDMVGRCIDETFCPFVQCLLNEEYQECPNKCNTTCRNYGDPTCEEDGQCYPGCFCPENYFMNDFRRCVVLEECPPDSNGFVASLAEISTESEEPTFSQPEETPLIESETLTTELESESVSTGEESEAIVDEETADTIESTETELDTTTFEETTQTAETETETTTQEPTTTTEATTTSTTTTTAGTTATTEAPTTTTAKRTKADKTTSSDVKVSTTKRPKSRKVTKPVAEEESEDNE